MFFWCLEGFERIWWYNSRDEYNTKFRGYHRLSLKYGLTWSGALFSAGLNRRMVMEVRSPFSVPFLVRHVVIAFWLVVSKTHREQNQATMVMSPYHGYIPANFSTSCIVFFYYISAVFISNKEEARAEKIESLLFRKLCTHYSVSETEKCKRK